MVEIVMPVRSQFRRITHDLRTWHAAGQAIVTNRTHDTVLPFLRKQVAYTDRLIAEYTKNKHELGELQLWAEQAKAPTPGARNAVEREVEDRATEARRKAKLAIVHKKLRSLAVINGYGKGKAGYTNGFRNPYVDALTCLRRALKDSGIPDGWSPLRSNSTGKPDP
jgi:hypothetical protein